jgi:predicted PolB exonuclease-like 3'-5' exonuclease
MNYFDIETEPLPDEELALVKPTFTAPRSWKDPAKIAAEIAEKEVAWKENAALSAVTGRVLAIGIIVDGVFRMIDPQSQIEAARMQSGEAPVIREFWGAVSCSSEKWAGFNSFRFDLPFLIRRSWKLGIEVPRVVREGRWWGTRFVDLRELWQLGDREAGGGLDEISRFFGHGQKLGSGANFAKLYHEDHGKAREYLEQDLRLTQSMWHRIGGVA